MTSLKPLKGFDSFTTVFKTGKKFYDNDCLAVFIFTNQMHDNLSFVKCNDENTFYYGVSAGKRYIKKAVLRNRLKRLLRESVRQVFKLKYSDNENFPFKYTVFTLKSSPGMQSLIKLSDVYPSVERIFLAAEKHYNNKYTARQ